MPLGLRTLFALRPRPEPVPMEQALLEPAERARVANWIEHPNTRGPQRPAAFELDFVLQHGGEIWIRPRAARPLFYV